MIAVREAPVPAIVVSLAAHRATGDRLHRLAKLDWTLDGKFGNDLHHVAADRPTAIIANHIQRTLMEAYAAEVADLEIKTAWVADMPCPPRNRPSQYLAGIVNDASAGRAYHLITAAMPLPRFSTGHA
ncbi:MAG: hypothetical protein GC182_09520 [Rhodopseudomonas sp.]|nr:hypothetical protein [Rhodopseudomonas sp.]